MTNALLLKSRSEKAMARRLGLCVWAVCAFFSNGYIGNPMSNSMVDLTVSLVEHHAVSIDSYAGNSGDVATRNGHFYSGLAPGASWLLLPPYLAAKPAIDFAATPAREELVQERVTGSLSDWKRSEDRLRILLASFACCVLGSALLSGWVAALLFLLFRRWYPAASATWSAAVAAGTIISTNLFFYATSIDHRFFAIAALLTALWLASGTLRPWTGFCFGLCLGQATATSYESMLVIPALLVWWRQRHGLRQPAVLMLGIALPISVLLAYQTWCFGGALTTPYAFRANPKYLALHGYNSAFPLSIGESLERAFSSPGPLAELLFGPRAGLFYYSPLLLLCLCLFVSRWRQGLRADVLLLALTAAIPVFAFHFLTGYDGYEGDFGPRYLAMVIPFLMLLLPALKAPGSFRYGMWALGLVAALRGVMYGLLHEPFWGGYLQLLGSHGLTSYSLLKLAIVRGTEFGLILSTLLVVCLFVAAAWVLRPFWSRRWLGDSDEAQSSSSGLTA